MTETPALYDKDTYVFVAIPKIGQVQGGFVEEVVQGRGDVLLDVAETYALPEEHIRLVSRRLGDMIMNYYKADNYYWTGAVSETTDFIESPLRYDKNGVTKSIETINNSSPVPGIEIRREWNRDRIISTYRLGNISLAQRLPTAEEAATFEARRQRYDETHGRKSIVGLERERRREQLRRLDGDFSELVGKDYVQVTHKDGAVFILPLESPLSYVGVRCLVALKRQYADRKDERAPLHITATKFAQAVATDMSEAERAIMLMRETYSNVVPKDQLRGPVVRFLKTIGVGMNLVRGEGRDDFRYVGGIESIKLLQTLEEADNQSRMLRLVMSPEVVTASQAGAELPSKEQLELAQALTRIIKAGHNLEQDRAIDCMNLLMSRRGRHALRRNLGDSPDLMDDLHAMAKSALRGMYHDALSNRTIAGNTTTGGDAGTISLTSGGNLFRVKNVLYGNEGRWAIKDLQLPK